MIAIFLAPISAGIKIDKNNELAVRTEVNKVKAWSFKAATLEQIFGLSFIQKEGMIVNSNSAVFSGEIKVSKDYILFNSTDPGKSDFLEIYESALEVSNPDKGILFVIKEGNTVIAAKSWYELQLKGKTGQPQFDKTKVNNPFTINTLDIAGPLSPNTTYTVNIQINDDRSVWTIGFASAGPHTTKPIPFTTTNASLDDPTVSGQNNAKSAYGEGELNLGCTDLTNFSIKSCIVQVTYIIWSVSALIARLAAHFLDFFIYYATNSSSYSNTFVEKAWAAVRDVANIFFIIALLYVAIKTILGLNVTDNKKLIGSVIIVGLIINFSLFTTKVVIDGSNILAKIFYNNITSKDASAPRNANGALQDSVAGVGGQKSISIGIVDKFNPQGLVTQKNYTDNTYTFIFMVLLLIIVTLYTAYIFFIVSLLFVARVVSLWISMIFSPIAFASYTLPFDIPGFGHKEWWSDLLKNAFLAPLFIFFLYIIILFTGFLKDIINYTDSPNLDTMANLMQRIMSVTIPFIIIVMLLSKAKELAIKYSGEMGKAIQGIGAAVGGLALGGASMLGAAAGRASLGKIMKGASQSESAQKFDRFNKAEIKYGEVEKHYTEKHGKASKEHEEATNRHAEVLRENSSLMHPEWTDEQKKAGQEKIVAARKEMEEKGTKKTEVETERTQAQKELDVAKEEKEKLGVVGKTMGGLGSYINRDQEHVEHAQHARHELDTEAAARFGGKKFKDLTGIERQTIVERVSKNEEAQKWYGKKYKDITKSEKDDIDRKIEKKKADGEKTEGEKFVELSKEKQGLKSNLLQASRTGTYDVRNLSKITAGEFDNVKTKFAKGITSAIAGGIRGGLKSSLNINYGEGQGKIIKDLGHTITESLKGAKLNVNLSGLGEVKAEVHKGGHGGGGHDTGHGGGGHTPSASGESHEKGEEHTSAH